MTEITTNENLSKISEQTHALRVQLQPKETMVEPDICVPPYHPVSPTNMLCPTQSLVVKFPLCCC